MLLRSSQTHTPVPRAAAETSSLLALTRLGWGLALPVLLLCLIGIACIHAVESQSPAFNVQAELEPAAPSELLLEEHWLTELSQAVGLNTAKQVLFLATGLLLLLAVLWPGYSRLVRLAYPFYGIVMVLLSLLMIDRYIVDIPDVLVPVRQNSRRWVTFGGGFGIQPSEFMKLALVLALARYLRFRDSYRTWLGLLPPFLLALVPAVLILRQPNLGTCMMLLPVLFGVLFVAGARVRQLLTIVLAGAALMPAFYFFGMKDYQRERVLVFVNQNTDDEEWHKDQGYQLRLGKIALATGGLWGRGYGQGEFVNGSLTLPEARNDFIFSIVGHEFGLVGCLVVIACYGMIVVFGLEIAAVTNDPFGKLIAIGVIVMIVVQALFNMATNIGLAPITGVPLPFVSAGGSSLWANFLGLGLLINVAQRRPMRIAHPPFEHGESP